MYTSGCLGRESLFRVCVHLRFTDILYMCQWILPLAFFVDYRPPPLGRKQDLKVEQKHYKASVCVVSIHYNSLLNYMCTCINFCDIIYSLSPLRPRPVP